MRRGAATRLVVITALGAVTAVAARALRGQPAPVFSAPPPTDGPLLQPAPAPAPASEPAAPPAEAVGDEPAADAPRPPGERWVFPVEGGCPPGHPIKAKLRSGLYHLPGMFAYERTNPDRCYATEVDARADGLQRAKR